MPNSFTSSFRRYLWRLLAVQAAVLLAGLGASMALVKYVVEPNDRIIQSLALIQQATSTDAAFGDSRFAWGFVGTPVFPTIAAEGETLADMELRVRYYFRDKQPGKVIIQGDPHAFSAYKLDRATHAYLNNLDDTFWQRFLDHHRPYLNLYWQRYVLGGREAFRPKDEVRWGWIVGHEQWSAVDSTVRVGLTSARVEHQIPSDDFRNNVFAQSYRRTLAYLQHRGAQICVVTTPVSYEYLRDATRDPRTQQAIAFLKQIAEENGARYVNFFDLYAQPQYEDYFRDMDHLNQNGAPKFTERVMSACYGPERPALASGTH